MGRLFGIIECGRKPDKVRDSPSGDSLEAQIPKGNSSRTAARKSARPQLSGRSRTFPGSHGREARSQSCVFSKEEYAQIVDLQLRLYQSGTFRSVPSVKATIMYLVNSALSIDE